MPKKLVSLSSLVAVAIALFSVAPGVAHAEYKTCHPDEVMELSNRIHVRCSDPVTVGTGNAAVSITFVAIANSSTALAARFLAIANAALLSDIAFRFDISTSSATNTTGCSASNCRTPAAFGLEP